MRALVYTSMCMWNWKEHSILTQRWRTQNSPTTWALRLHAWLCTAQETYKYFLTHTAPINTWFASCFLNIFLLVWYNSKLSCAGAPFVPCVGLGGHLRVRGPGCGTAIWGLWCWFWLGEQQFRRQEEAQEEERKERQQRWHQRQQEEEEEEEVQQQWERKCANDFVWVFFLYRGILAVVWGSILGSIQCAKSPPVRMVPWLVSFYIKMYCLTHTGCCIAHSTWSNLLLQRCDTCLKQSALKGQEERKERKEIEEIEEGQEE